MLDGVISDGDRFVWSHTDTTIKNEEFDEYAAAFIIYKAFKSIFATTSYSCVDSVIFDAEKYFCDVQCT